MKTACAWCKKDLGDKPPYDNQETSHGICPDCYKKQTGHDCPVKNYTQKDLEQVAKTLGIDLASYSELLPGMRVELEHCDVTQGTALLSARIALAHLREDPQYYTKLAAMEAGKPVTIPGAETGTKFFDDVYKYAESWVQQLVDKGLGFDDIYNELTTRFAHAPSNLASMINKALEAKKGN
jgi:hypothetical protein